MEVGCWQLRQLSNAAIVLLEAYRTAHQDHPFGNLPVQRLGANVDDVRARASQIPITHIAR